jgi:predicted nucleic acid-binding protein
VSIKDRQKWGDFHTLFRIGSFYEVITVTKRLIFSAVKIHSKCKFSFFDSLIVAAALEENCDILYSEDMQDGQIIENTLKIVNSFFVLHQQNYYQV